MKVLITQSNYIPWKGYFDAINLADVFVVYDDMQYTKRDWRNRNKIKTKEGLKWLSIPVQVKGKYYQKINETVVTDQNWKEKHWKSIVCSYNKSEFFKDYRQLFQSLYLDKNYYYLSDINLCFIQEISKILDIKTKIISSRDFNLTGNKTEKLLNICKSLNATDYISGPAAKDYFEIELFKDNNINVVWMDYSDYPEYQQLFGDFEHYVSIIDLIFNTGSNARKYMNSFRELK